MNEMNEWNEYMNKIEKKTSSIYQYMKRYNHFNTTTYIQDKNEVTKHYLFQ